MLAQVYLYCVGALRAYLRHVPAYSKLVHFVIFKQVLRTLCHALLCIHVCCLNTPNVLLMFGSNDEHNVTHMQ